MHVLESSDIENMKTSKNIKGLVKALGYQKDRVICKAAAEALGEINTQALIKALRNTNQDVRNCAAEKLVSFGPSIVDQLIVALKKGNHLMRISITGVLGEIGDPKAIEPLFCIIKEDVLPSLRVAATTALSKMGATAIEPLSVKLKDSSLLVRRAATQALGEIGDVSAIGPLITALADVEKVVRRAAVGALVKIDSPHVVTPLIDALKDDSDYVRKAAAMALSVINDPRAVEEINRIKGIECSLSSNEPQREEPLKCKRCGSTHLYAGDKGFGLGKAAIGSFLIGPVGLLGGLIGSKKSNNNLPSVW
jgi:bilin biosynthesis protein